MSSYRNRWRSLARSVAAIAARCRCAMRGVRARRERSRNTGGTLEIGTVYVTLSALSWDPADWNWKHNHDTGQFYEQLFAADLSQVEAATAASIRSMPTPGCRPTPSAASWPKAGSGSKNPLRVEIKLRKGVMFPEKPGVMAARELTADDVVFSLQPPRQEPEEDRRLFRPCRQGRGHRQAHGRVHLQELQRRVGLSLRLGLLLRRSCRRKSPTPAPATGRTSTAPGRSC